LYTWNELENQHYEEEANALSIFCCSFMLSSEHVKDGFSAIGGDYGKVDPDSSLIRTET